MRIWSGAVAIVLGGIFSVGFLTPCEGAVWGTSGGPIWIRVIRSRADLQQYLAVAAQTGSPLNALSPGARRRFLASMKFNAAGVTTFRYDDLQNELTVRQAYDVLALSGSSVTSESSQDYAS